MKNPKKWKTIRIEADVKRQLDKFRPVTILSKTSNKSYSSVIQELVYNSGRYKRQQTCKDYIDYGNDFSLTVLINKLQEIQEKNPPRFVGYEEDTY